MHYAYVIYLKANENDKAVLDSIWSNERSARNRQQQLMNSGFIVSFDKCDINRGDLNYKPRMFYRKDGDLHKGLDPGQTACH